MGTAGTKTTKKPLDKYWQKRDFTITSEPRGRVGAKTRERLSYFIQRHHARRLHYDFRLELDGTLKSWAIPKGPSFDPADKRLAVHVEDHPLDYGTFEGEIPAHQYGAGKVILWDRGTWIPQGDPRQGLRKGHLKFRLEGEKLAGLWALVRMGEASEEKENWLLIKEHDEEARTGKAAAITELRPESVLHLENKKTDGKKARDDARAARTSKGAKGNADLARTLGLPLEQLKGARKDEMPELIKPQLATLSDRAPPGDDWLLEIKFDGYRAVTRIERGHVKIYTRAGNDWTRKWKDIAACARHLPVEQAWIDGEVVAIDETGAVNFQLLQNMDREHAQGRLVYYVFDLPYLDGYDLRDVPLVRRKQLLKDLLADADPEGPIIYSDHLAGDADAVFTHACHHHLEGVIAKRADARYESTRSRSWLKVKCVKRQEFVIGGYTDPAGSRDRFGALLVGVYDDDGKLRYAGKVGTGFDATTLKSVFKALAKAAATTTPFSDPPTGADARGVHWLKPELVAEVKFAQWTNGNHIRHAAFIGLRSDKRPQDIRREVALPVKKAVAESEMSRARATRAREETAESETRDTGRETSARRPQENTVAGIKLSNPTRVLYPEMGLTKLEFAQYYDDIADWVLPHLAQRPLTLVRCPNGVGKECFYQKHANQTTGREVARINIPGAKKAETYMMANSLPGLISLVQMGVLELHTWGAHRGALDKPDRITFDLDPAPDLPWARVIEAAQLVKGLLEEIGLRSFVKTTGGKGLHVVVPLKGERPWDEVKAFSRAVAHHFATTLPDRYTAKMTKSTRTGKIFIDYLRNGWEATAVAAYSTRARRGAPVSTPLAWKELSEELRSNSYTVANIRERLAGLRDDPWEDYFALKQRLTPKMLRTFGVE